LGKVVCLALFKKEFPGERLYDMGLMVHLYYFEFIINYSNIKMNKQSIREIFDNISLSVISFLENHIGITDVEFTERQGKITLSHHVQESLKLLLRNGRKKMDLIYFQMITRRSCRFQMASVSIGKSRKMIKFFH
jgi:hypothetical protein